MLLHLTVTQAGVVEVRVHDVADGDLPPRDTATRLDTRDLDLGRCAFKQSKDHLSLSMRASKGIGS